MTKIWRDHLSLEEKEKLELVEDLTVEDVMTAKRLLAYTKMAAARKILQEYLPPARYEQVIREIEENQEKELADEMLALQS